MLVNKGDKLIVTKDVANFLRKGEVVEVIDINGDMISFVFGDGMHKGLMNFAECEAHFTKYVEPKVVPTVTEEMIEDIINHSNITVDTIFEKCTVVSCRLPNGFVIVESSACVSPENYDEEMGVDICMGKIIDKIWELEGYKLQDELYQTNKVKELNKAMELLAKVSDNSVEDLNELADKLLIHGIDIHNSENFKSLYDVLGEIAEVWNEICEDEEETECPYGCDDCDECPCDGECAYEE